VTDRARKYRLDVIYTDEHGNPDGGRRVDALLRERARREGGAVSIKPSYARHRTDRGSKELIALLEAAGARYMPLGGAIDGAAYVNDAVALVDFKASPKSKKTKTQAKLVAAGAPIWFLATSEDVLAVVAFLKALR